MKENLLAIINHYGIAPQQKKFAEEFFELEEAIMTYEKCHMYAPRETISKDYEQSLMNHIVEEMADVLVLLDQFMVLYNIEPESVFEVMKTKVNRQLKRIEN